MFVFYDDCGFKISDINQKIYFNRIRIRYILYNVRSIMSMVINGCLIKHVLICALAHNIII